MSDSVLAMNDWDTNGHMVADIARLDLLRPEWSILDVTYGYGTFWNEWKPERLVGCDLNPEKSPIGYAVDFTQLPFGDRSFVAVVIDPPYKLNGTPTDDVDERYGVHVPAGWRERMALIRAGVRECARVSELLLFVKVQDQVVSSKIRWQTIAVVEEAEALGFGLRARFDYLARRPQPEGRKQINPQACSSQLLVLQRGWRWKDADSPLTRENARLREALEVCSQRSFGDCIHAWLAPDECPRCVARRALGGH